jgi:hypothetical protein
MRKQPKMTATQFPLFPPVRRVHLLPGEIPPKVIPLLARLLHQHVRQESTPSRRQEVKNERQD